MNTVSVIEFLKTSGVHLLQGIVVMIVGFFTVHWVLKLLEKNNKLTKMDSTIRSFLHHLLRLVLYILVILTAANVIGVPMTSILTLLATAGAAVSLAMQGAMGNLIGGFILLILKPIKVGEYVEIGNYQGTVKAVGSFYTDLVTFDGLHVSLPNGTLTNTSIINYTREGTRRMELTFSVSYDADIRKTASLLQEVVAAEKQVLNDPAPSVLLKTLNASSLDFVIRAWAKVEDYWDCYFRLIKAGKEALDQAGIKIPYPQMDVHIRSVPSQANDEK